LNRTVPVVSSLDGKFSPVVLTPPLALADTDTDRAIVPPAPLQLSVKVLVPANKAALTAEPLIPRLPLHAPLATQPVVLLLDQVKVVELPATMLLGFAANVTVGAGVGAGDGAGGDGAGDGDGDGTGAGDGDGDGAGAGDGAAPAARASALPSPPPPQAATATNNANKMVFLKSVSACMVRFNKSAFLECQASQRRVQGADAVDASC